jgi:hypothetical protein
MKDRLIFKRFATMTQVHWLTRGIVMLRIYADHKNQPVI